MRLDNVKVGFDQGAAFLQQRARDIDFADIVQQAG
jgi:hypothetical protein